MKKILSVVLALAMLLSVGSMIAFAAETSTLAIVIDGDAPTKIGDVFKVNVVVKDMSANTFSGVAPKFNYNTAVIAPANAKGELVTKVAQAIVARDDMYDADEEEGVFAFEGREVNFETGFVKYSLYIHQSQTEFPNAKKEGIPMTGDYAAPFTIFSMYFKVIGEGDSLFAFADECEINYAPGQMAELSFEVPTIKIGEGGDEPDKDKVVTAFEASATVDLADVADFDASAIVVKATVDGKEEAIAVDWDKEDIAKVKAATEAGTIEVKGTLPEGYVTEGEVKIVATITVTKTDTDPVPDKTVKSVEAVNVPPVIAGATEAGLPTKVKATLADGTEVELDITWEDVDLTTPGTKTVKGTVSSTDEEIIIPDEFKTVEATVVVVEASNLPVIVTPVWKDTPNGKFLAIAASLNPNYDGDAAAALADEIVIAVNYLNGTTPVFEDGKKSVRFITVSKTAIVEGFETSDNWAAPKAATLIEASAVQYFDPEAPISGDNLGQGVAIAASIPVK